MPDTSNLASRIDAEFTALGERQKKAQAEQLQAYEDRQKRIAHLQEVFDQLRDIWKPRLEMLVQKFGDRVQVTPRIVPATREALFEFQSKLAGIRLRFSATTDRDVRKMTLSSDLEIIPVLWKYDAHSDLEFPIGAIDKDAVARWIDERIVSFVKTYIAIHENEFYFKDEMVEDPVAGVRFPRFTAGATLEHEGKTYYFLSEETRRDFEKQHEAAAKT